MAKRIVICSDGTGNTAIKGRGTNVFKLFEAVDLNGHRLDAKLKPQVAIYDDGVGTQKLLPLRLLGGAFGWGLSRNVKHLYCALARIYDPNDQIFVFGFSRGAFTVRTLVGFIATCGLVDRQKLKTGSASELKSLVNRAYRTYRKCYRTRLSQWLWGQPAGNIGATFKRQYSLDTDVRIRFVGCWDTVDAVGLPFHIADFWNATFYRFKFPDRKLSPIVERACQALAIDEPRQSFAPVLWEETGDSRIDQVWFSGAHSNVGGGYPKQGMSIVALDWMLTEAERADKAGDAGLRLNQDERRSYREHANVDDKLYDPRRGLGIFYRWKLRDVEALCRDHSVRPKIHISVLERVAHGTEEYAPGNFPRGAQVVVTEPETPMHVELASLQGQSAERVLSKAHRRLLDNVKDAVVVGTLSYYVYLVGITGVAAMLVLSAAAPAGPNVPLWSVIANVVSLFAGLATNPIQNTIYIWQQLLNAPHLVWYFIAALVLSFILDLYADRRMSRVFSAYWFKKQQDLRTAFKEARHQMGATV